MAVCVHNRNVTHWGRVCTFWMHFIWHVICIQLWIGHVLTKVIVVWTMNAIKWFRLDTRIIMHPNNEFACWFTLTCFVFYFQEDLASTSRAEIHRRINCVRGKKYFDKWTKDHQNLAMKACGLAFSHYTTKQSRIKILHIFPTVGVSLGTVPVFHACMYVYVWYILVCVKVWE